MIRIYYRFFGVLMVTLAMCQCQASSRRERENTGGDTNSDGDTSLLENSDGDTSLFEDAAPLPAGSNECPGHVQSFIWIANTGEGTLSKVCTINGEEVARYLTSPFGTGGDPSRTSVNMHGDMVVTNRDPSGPSSVTKFAADSVDCIDRNNNGKIDTSLGPQDVKPWNDDECMLWNRRLTGAPIGARATAWDGEEDPDTGKGGHVWIGSIMPPLVFKLDGDTGKILAQKALPIGAYGGAIDGKGGFWIVDMLCTVMSVMGACNIGRVDMETLNTRLHTVNAGYGISVDSKGRIWTAGMNGVVRFDPTTNEKKALPVFGFNRGIAVDTSGSAWVANTDGSLIQVNQETVKVIKRFPVGVAEMVGVAVDFEGYVWTVSQGGNAAYKVDPKRYTFETIPIGLQPYTYSDMTGMQLRQIVEVVK